MKHLLPLLLLAFSASASAKDLRNRAGFGFDQQFGQVSAFSLRYGLPTDNAAQNIQVEGLFGFSAYKDSQKNIFGGGKLLYGVVAEDNMNLYLGGGAGVAVEGDTTVMRVPLGVTADFFLFGLENLGFSTGVGLNIDLGQGGSGAGTGGTANAGIHYWF